MTQRRDCRIPMVPADERRFEVARRESATLIGGDPADRGAVTVLMPERRRIYRELGKSAIQLCVAFFWIAILLVGVITQETYWFHPAWLFYLLLGMPLCPLLCASAVELYTVMRQIPACWRPCYIAMDDTGIGVAQGGKTLSARWADVVDIRRRTIGGGLMLKSTGGSRVWLNLAGYAPEAQKHIQALIKERMASPANAPALAGDARLPLPGGR